MIIRKIRSPRENIEELKGDVCVRRHKRKSGLAFLRRVISIDATF